MIIKKLKTIKWEKILELIGFHRNDIYGLFTSRLIQGDEQVKSRVEKSEKQKFPIIRKTA